MEAFLPSIGLISGLISLVAAVRLVEQQARSTHMAVVELRNDPRHSDRWSPTGPK
ncbi:MAG: hypothetical protein QOG87_3428 [Actinomycetota bacterium]|jgi:hypothetical protein